MFNKVVFKGKKDKTFVYDILSTIWIVASTILVGCVLVFFINTNTQNIKTRQQQVEHIIDNSIKDLEAIISNIRNTTLVISYDSELLNRTFSKSSVENQEAASIGTTLEKYCLAEYIESIYLYNSETDIFYGTHKSAVLSENFDDKSIIETIDKLSNDRKIKMVVRKKSNDKIDTQGFSNTVLSFVYFLHSNNKDAVVVNIDYAEAFRFIEKYDMLLNGSEYIIADYDGEIIFHNGTNDLIGTSVKERFLVTNYENIFFKKKVTKYSESTRLWFLIDLNSANFAPGYDMGQLILLCVLVFVGLIGFLLSVHLGRKIAVPIEKLAVDNEILQWKMEKIKLNDVIIDLIYEKNLSKIKEIIAKNNLVINMNKDVCLIKVKTFSLLSEENVDERTKIEKTEQFAVLNVFEEIFGIYDCAYSTEIGNDELLFIVQNEKYDFIDLKCRIEFGIDIIREHVMRDVYVTIGELCNIGQINQAYMNVIKCEKNSYFMKKSEIVNANHQYLTKSENSISKWADEISKIFLKGKKAEIEEYICKIFDLLYSESIDTAKYCILKLCTAFMEHTTINEDNSKLFNIIYDGVLNSQRLEEAKRIFLDNMRLLNFVGYEKYEDDKVMKENVNRQTILIESITEIIENRFMDPLLCVEKIAQELNLSSIYLGRFYKTHRPYSIPEYILKCRLNNACELLENTNASIAKIAEDSGFSNSNYFSTLFKKHYMVSPVEYRRNIRLGKEEKN